MTQEFLSPLDRFKKEFCDHCFDKTLTANGRCLLCFFARLIETLEDLPASIAAELSEFKIEAPEEEARVIE